MRSRLGAVRTFNIVYLLLLAVCGLGIYALAEYKTGKPLESFVAGALTAASPCVLARSTEHLNLLAIGVVPAFVCAWAMALDRAPHSVARGLTAAVAAGIALATAAYGDPYLAVYCVVLATIIAAARCVDISFQRRRFFGFGGSPRRTLDGIVAAVGVVVASIVVSGGWSVTVGGATIVARSLYTPVLALTLLAIARVLWWRNVRVMAKNVPAAARLVGLTLASILTATSASHPGCWH